MKSPTDELIDRRIEGAAICACDVLKRGYGDVAEQVSPHLTKIRIEFIVDHREKGLEGMNRRQIEHAAARRLHRLVRNAEARD